MPRLTRPDRHGQARLPIGVREVCEGEGTVDVAVLIAEFNGRQFDGRKVTADRVHRYISYCRNHGILKIVVTK